MDFRLVFIFLILSSACHKPCATQNINDAIWKVITSVSKIIDFYDNSYENINLDCLFGLRIFEGMIQHTLNMDNIMNDSHDIHFNVTSRLKSLLYKSRRIASQALIHVKKENITYFKLMEPLVSRPFTTLKPYKYLDFNLQWGKKSSRDSDPVFDEEGSDYCMSSLMGTTRGVKSCTFPDKCLRVMFTRQQEEYTLTHQLLYTMLAEEEGCYDILEKAVKQNNISKSIEDMRLEFCSNMVLEMKYIINLGKGRIIPDYQDLFMEQLFVCANLGFMEILHFDWMNQIISWQGDNGCFTSINDKLTNSSYDKSEKHISRNLKIEKEIEGNCLVHKTAVALGALVNFIRFILVPGSTEFRQNVKLDGKNILYPTFNQNNREPNLKRNLETERNSFTSLYFTYFMFLFAMIFVLYTFYIFVRNRRVTIRYRR